MRLPSLMGATLLAAFSSWALAESDPAEQIRSRLEAVNSQIAISEVKPSQIKGLYEVVLASGEVLYSGPTGEYFVLGQLYQAKGESFVNLTEQRKKTERAELIANIDAKEMVIFAPQGEVKHRLNVFTDVDCGYCRKLHSEIQAYNELGIEVRYLAFPRAGIGSDSYDKMVSVWCADDKQTAMTKVKQNQPIDRKTCDNPVERQYQLGHRLGVTGTPALVFEDGSLMPGYVPAERLQAFLEES